MKLVRLLYMHLNETYTTRTVDIDKYLSEMFPIQNGVKQDGLFLLLFNFTLE
jgi:hypothetical protein